MPTNSRLEMNAIYIYVCIFKCINTLFPSFPHLLTCIVRCYFPMGACVFYVGFVCVKVAEKLVPKVGPWMPCSQSTFVLKHLAPSNFIMFCFNSSNFRISNLFDLFVTVELETFTV